MKCHARVICKQFGEIEALRMDKDPAWQGGNNCNLQLGGGFKYCWSSSLPGEMIQFD